MSVVIETSTLYMSVPVAYESPGKSFEELRIDDYLHAYSTTGRPPLPCPQIPTDSASRSRAGLPPLFEPFTESKLPDSTTIRDPSALPAAQVFNMVKIDGESFQSLSVMPMYRFYSHEELRIYAYLQGNKVSPTPITMYPFVVTPVVAAPVSTDSANNYVSPPGEQLLAISTQSQYSGHSLEELRVAFLQAGRELTSAEIVARASSPTKPPPQPQGSAFGTSTYPFTPPAATRPF